MIDIKKHFILSCLFLTFPLWYLVSNQSLRLPSPASYFVASPELSERVALRPEQMLKNKELLEEQQVKSKIWKVISRHRTGLAAESLEQIPHQIYQESKNYGYDPLLLTALIVTESSFNNWAKSHKGALGLMQIKPATGQAMASEIGAAWAGHSTLFDPAMNIALGAFYLNKLKRRFKDMKIALEAYNHGPSRISRYLRKGKLPQDYSRKVFQIYELIRS